MNGRTETGRQRLAEAIDAAHEALQDAHAKLYEVQLATERAENDQLAAIPGGVSIQTQASADFARMRTEIAELRPLLVPIVRWTQAARRAAMTPAEVQAHNEEVLRRGT